MKIRFAGKIYQLEKTDIDKALRGVDPEMGRRFFVAINGREYPIKQAVSKTIGRPVTEIGTNTAYSALRRLGFAIIDTQEGCRHE